MNCRTFADRVDEMLDGLLPPGEIRDLRAHALECAECAKDEQRAAAFRTFLAAEGAAAMAAAADREATTRAVSDTPGARRGVIRRLLVPAGIAAAAAVAAFFAGREASVVRPTETAYVSGASVLARGEHRTLGAGRSVLADESTALHVYDGYADAGERVRMDSGSAMFQVESGRPFVVETVQGAAEVHGTLFHVRRSQDRAVRVGVVSGVVVFRPARGGNPVTLRDGALLDVRPDGRQRLTTRSEIEELEVRAGMQDLTIEALRGDLAKREEEAAALRARLSGDGTSLVAATDTPGMHWREIGAALRKLFTLTGRPDDPAVLEAMAPLHANARELTEVTGSSEAYEWPWHPAVMSRGAEGFIDAFAPDADPADRARAADALRAVAIGYSLDAPAGALPAESRAARLRMLRGTIVVVRDHLGMDAAAEIARAVQASRAGAPVWPEVSAETARRHTLESLVRSLGLTDAQREETAAHVDRWIEGRRDAQAQILREWGEDAGMRFLFGPRPAAGIPPVTDDSAALVGDALRRIDAKLALVAPRIELEQFVAALLDPVQADRKIRNLRGLGEVFITTIP